jgi:hypothetical protein
MADTDDRIVRIEAKLDKVVDHIGAIDSTLAAQHVSLSEHMRRTSLLEQEVAPISTHVAMVTGVIKAVALIAAVLGGVEGLISLINYLKGVL